VSQIDFSMERRLAMHQLLAQVCAENRLHRESHTRISIQQLADGFLGPGDIARRKDSLHRGASLRRDDQNLEANVRIENLAGHVFPSGVAFRRAFITFEALDEAGKVVWASGRTNSIGAIVKGASEEVLPTEFFYDPATRKQVFQTHYQTITSENQVQIYEELVADPQGKITTSFTALNQPLKNNRQCANL